MIERPYAESSLENGGRVIVPLKGLIDREATYDRFEKQHTKIHAEYMKHLDHVGSPAFYEKAKPELWAKMLAKDRHSSHN